jgi:hypothetical protein
LNLRKIVFIIYMSLGDFGTKVSVVGTVPKIPCHEKRPVLTEM